MKLPVGALIVDQGRLAVSPYELYPDSQARRVYEFLTSPTILPSSLRFSSTYESMHRDLEDTHEIDHSLEACPERLHPLPVKMWTPACGWTEIKIKPVD